MIESRIQSFLPLKTQWFHIMLSLAGEEQHGYGIMQEVLQRTTGKVRLWPATLYGSIKRLIEADLIEESSDPARSRARRRSPPLLPPYVAGPPCAQRRMRAAPGAGSGNSDEANDAPRTRVTE